MQIILHFDIHSTVPFPSSSTQPRQPITMHAVVFESIAQGNSFIAEVETPTLLIANSVNETTNFTKWLHDIDITSQLRKTNFNTHLVIAVFSGKKGSSGYSITINEIFTALKEVMLVVNLIKPEPGQRVQEVITYPYHIILLPKNDLQITPGTIWNVYSSEGVLLTKTIYP